MSRFSPTLFALLAAATGAISAVTIPAAFAQTAPAPLSIGSRAPKLPVAEWVKGKPDSLSDGKVHVVEFWATWCGPCKTTIPHLTAMAKKYAGKADVTGISVWENSANAASTVKAFVTTMGAKMDYHVARDDAKGTIAKTWMEAAKRDGIPTAFVVDKTGTIVWIGHPMDGLDEVVGKVIAGKYSSAGAAKEMAAKQAEAAKAKDKYAKLDTLFGPALALAREKKFAEAVSAMDKQLEANPEYAGDVAPLKLSLLTMYDEAAAQAYAVKAAQAELKNNAQVLNAFAWSIVAPDSKMKMPDYAAAVSIAEAAVAASNAKEAAILDTLSYAYEKAGDIGKAITAEQKAVALYPAGSTDKGLADFKARIVSLKAKLPK